MLHRAMFVHEPVPWCSEPHGGKDSMCHWFMLPSPAAAVLSIDCCDGGVGDSRADTSPGGPWGMLERKVGPKWRFTCGL